MDKLEAMNAFAKVVAHGSYAEAGRRLGLTRSAVSKAVKELEQLLGVRLLDRTTRRVSATEAGRAYYERCVDILASVEETELQIARLHDEPRGVLKVNAPMSFGALYLGSAISEFMGQYPELTIEMALSDRFIDPIEEGVDVTVRIGELADSSLIARKLAPARLVLAASPDYLKAHGKPKSADDLKEHRCLHYGHTTSMPRWQLMVDGQPASVPVTAVMCSNNGDILRKGALQGTGIALLPTFIIGQDIADGALRQVLPECEPTPLGIYALYAPNRYLAAKTRVLIDFLRERFGQKPSWDEF
ncbi:MAG: LysR family transcriptional regulator [Filomicrobium sp.]